MIALLDIRFAVPYGMYFRWRVPVRRLRLLAALFPLVSPLLIGQTPAVPTTPLDALDQTFLGAYTARTAAIQTTNPPYIEVLGSRLALHLHGQNPPPVSVLTEPYHRLKDVAHVPFTIYLLLHGQGDAQFSDVQISTLRDLQTKLTAAADGLPGAGFDPRLLKRQQEILGASATLLNTVLEAKVVDAKALSLYTRSMAPLMLQNAEDAGCFQVQATHKQVLAWKTSMTEQDWKDLRILNKNSHQARYRNAATQYFAWLLGGSSPSWGYPGETSRVIYVETLFKNQTDADEMLAVIVDLDASRNLFGNEWRMSEDILSDGAARCIAQLPNDDRQWKSSSGAAQ